MYQISGRPANTGRRKPLWTGLPLTARRRPHGISSSSRPKEREKSGGLLAGAMWVEDVKGFETEGFRLKRDLWRETFRGLPLRVIKNGRVTDE